MKHLHRSHVAPLAMDSNSAQFERTGNPWISERDRREMPIYGGRAKPARSTPKLADDKRHLGKFPKVLSRTDSAALRETRRSAAFLNLFKSGLPGGTRAVAPAKPPAPPAMCWIGSRETADPVDAYLENLALAMMRQRQGEERAERAAFTAKCDRADAMDRRLAKVFADMGDFAEAMAEAFDA